MTEKEYLTAQLDELRRAYEKAAKPIIERLIKIASMDVKTKILTTQEQAEALREAGILR